MTDPDVVRQIEALETRVERRLVAAIAPITAALERIEKQTTKTNGRVTRIELARVAEMAAATARKEERETAAKLALATAEAAVQARERSRKWWLGRGTLALLALSTATPLMGALLRALHVIHS